MRNTFQVLLGLTLVFGLGLGMAFAGGAFYGRRTTKAVAAPVATTAAGGGAGATFGGAGGGGGGAGGTGGQGGGAAAGAQGTAAAGQGGGQAAAGGAGRGGAIGVIEKVEGNTLTLRTQQGTATVTLAADTSVMQTTAAQAADLKQGQTVTVAGTADAEGKIAARTVTISAQQRP
jgi:hypothetical protein